MWIPQTEADIIQAINNRTLEETATFDAKQELPPSKELAKDVAAMSTDGGSLLIGVAEDKSTNSFQSTPIDLTGITERVSQIIEHTIKEPPYVDLYLIPTSVDPTRGYLVIAVPPSPHAPHMVIKGNDYRYYGRGPSGNRLLTEREVAHLYERRRRWEVDMDALLAEAIKQSPLAAHADYAYLYLVLRPVGTTRSLLDQARKDQDSPTYFEHLTKLANAEDVFPSNLGIDFWKSDWPWYKRVNGWAKDFGESAQESGSRDPRGVLDLQIDTDGSGFLFFGRAAEQRENHRVLLEQVVAGLTKRCLYLFGRLYADARYLGPVHIGLAVTNLEGVIPSIHRNLVRRARSRPFAEEQYRWMEQVPAAQLITDTQTVTERLVLPLIQTVTQGDYNPLER